MPVAKMIAISPDWIPFWIRRRTRRFTICALPVARVASDTTIKTLSPGAIRSSSGGESMGASSATPISSSDNGRKASSPAAGDAVTEEDMIRAAAQMVAFAGMADPTGLVTGVADVVAAYTYPKCSKYGYSPTGPPRPSSPSSSCANFVGEFETACRGANNGEASTEPEAQKDSNK